jgi:hypothetical protein
MKPPIALRAGLILAGLTLACGPAGTVLAQSGGRDFSDRKPVSTPTPAPHQLRPRPTLATTPAPRITGWHILQIDARPPPHGLTGQTLRINGSGFDPGSTSVALRSGARSVSFVRQPGGSATQIDYTIPPEAIKGGREFLLQADAGPGSAERFGVCDRVKIDALGPESIPYPPDRRAADGSYPLNRRELVLRGECLRGIEYERLGAERIFRVGSGRVVVGSIRETGFDRVVLLLDRYLPSPGSERSEGPIRLRVPESGPRFLIEDAFTHAVRPLAEGS